MATQSGWPTCKCGHLAQDHNQLQPDGESYGCDIGRFEACKRGTCGLGCTEPCDCLAYEPKAPPMPPSYRDLQDAQFGQ